MTALASFGNQARHVYMRALWQTWNLPCKVAPLFRLMWCRSVVLTLTFSRDPWGSCENTDDLPLSREILKVLTQDSAFEEALQVILIQVIQECQRSTAARSRILRDSSARCLFGMVQLSRVYLHAQKWCLSVLVCVCPVQRHGLEAQRKHAHLPIMSKTTISVGEQAGV